MLSGWIDGIQYCCKELVPFPPIAWNKTEFRPMTWNEAEDFHHSYSDLHSMTTKTDGRTEDYPFHPYRDVRANSKLSG